MPTDRRDQILDAAARMFARQGATATTVRQIADSVGILSGSLYHHFTSKDEILAEILGRYLRDLAGEYGAVLDRELDPVAGLEQLVLTSLRAAVRHQHAAEIYQNDVAYLRCAQTQVFADIIETGRYIENAWLKVITAGSERGQFRVDVPVDTFHRLAMGAVSLSVRWYQPTMQYPIEALARDCSALLLDGCRRTPTQAESAPPAVPPASADPSPPHPGSAATDPSAPTVQAAPADSCEPRDAGALADPVAPVTGGASSDAWVTAVGVATAVGAATADSSAPAVDAAMTADSSAPPDGVETSETSAPTVGGASADSSAPTVGGASADYSAAPVGVATAEAVAPPVAVAAGLSAPPERAADPVAPQPRGVPGDSVGLPDSLIG
jgi:AcrR family transcriptional regulator